MEDTMKVLELLEEIEDVVDEAPGLPLPGQIMVDAEEIFQIVRESDWPFQTMYSRPSGFVMREIGF